MSAQKQQSELVSTSGLILPHQRQTHSTGTQHHIAKWSHTGHFRVSLCLYFKTGLHSKPSIWKWGDLHENKRIATGGTHFHMTGFAWRLALTQRHKTSRKVTYKLDKKILATELAIWKQVFWVTIMGLQGRKWIKFEIVRFCVNESNCHSGKILNLVIITFFYE